MISRGSIAGVVDVSGETVPDGLAVVMEVAVVVKVVVP
jgi:hypothetical protein